ncbi:MAG: hypothetical protein ACI9LX_003698 [Paraglaciecola sp.]|jgi:hypothetical protein
MTQIKHQTKRPKTQFDMAKHTKHTETCVT